MKPNEATTLLTTPEAAEFLRLSPRTLERYRVVGTGPKFRKAGPGLRACVLYEINDLRNWVERKYGSTSEYSDPDGRKPDQMPSATTTYPSNKQQ